MKLLVLYLNVISLIFLLLTVFKRTSNHEFQGPPQLMHSLKDACLPFFLNPIFGAKLFSNKVSAIYKTII